MKKTVVLLVCAAAAMAAVVSCSLKPRNQVRNAAAVSVYDVVVVGKVVFEPPLTEETQGKLSPSDELFFRKTTLFVCDDKLRKLNRDDLEPKRPDQDDRISAYEGETFYSKSATKPFYIISGIFYKDVDLSSGSPVYKVGMMPGSFYVDISSGDRAVYIGTIKYYRNNFFNITKVEILDEYDAEMPLFRRMFGTMKLKKALIRQPGKGVVPVIGSNY